MVVHAAGQSAQLPEARSASCPTIAIALAATLDELVALERVLADNAVPHVFVREPDEPWRDAPMAIGIAPMPRAHVRRLVAHLPLVRGKDANG
jgi:hypothetical protein